MPEGPDDSIAEPCPCCGQVPPCPCSDVCTCGDFRWEHSATTGRPLHNPECGGFVLDPEATSQIQAE